MLRTMLALTFVTVLIAGCAAAQTVDLVANIPFAYQTRGVSMQAGEHRLVSLSPGVVRIENVAENSSVVFLAIPEGTKDPSRNGKGHITFRRYGNRYFLESITTPAGNVVAPRRTKLERELWANNQLKPAVIVIVAD